jgi:hypothetical protein
VILGGGAQITTTGTTGAQISRPVLRSSYPSSATQWTAVGVVTNGALASGDTMSVTAYAICSA